MGKLVVGHLVVSHGDDLRLLHPAAHLHQLLHHQADMDDIPYIPKNQRKITFQGELIENIYRRVYSNQTVYSYILCTVYCTFLFIFIFIYFYYYYLGKILAIAYLITYVLYCLYIRTTYKSCKAFILIFSLLSLLDILSLSLRSMSSFKSKSRTISFFSLKAKDEAPINVNYL